VGEITTLIGAIAAIADAIVVLARHPRGRRRETLLVLFVLSVAVIVLGLLGLSGVASLSFLP